MDHPVPKTQQAAIYTAIGRIEIQEVPVKTPEADECLIAVDRCGICGSDLHNYRGQSLRKTFAEWMKLGFADGHEYTGVVVAVGADVQTVAAGTRVAVECTRHCGTCPSCKQGLYNICDTRRDLVWRGNGGFAQYATAPAHAVVEVPERLSSKHAALVEPAACALRAVNRANMTPGDDVLVMGGGTIGALCGVMARIAGAGTVSLVCKYEHQRNVAQELGITSVLSPDDIRSEMARVAIEAVGTEQSFSAALKGVRRGGTIVLIGSPTERWSVAFGAVVGKELDVKGALTYAYHGGVTDFERVIDLMASGQCDLTPLVTHEFPLEDIATALETALDKTRGSVKVHVVPT